MIRYYFVLILIDFKNNNNKHIHSLHASIQLKIHVASYLLEFTRTICDSYTVSVLLNIKATV